MVELKHIHTEYHTFVYEGRSLRTMSPYSLSWCTKDHIIKVSKSERGHNNTYTIEEVDLGNHIEALRALQREIQTVRDKERQS